MRRPSPGKRRLWTGLLAGMLALGAVAADAAAQRLQDPRGRQGRRRSWRDGRAGHLKVGQLAPDFELPYLKFETKKDGTIVGRITKEKVKLSSFRGKQSVVLFFSSYT